MSHSEREVHTGVEPVFAHYRERGLSMFDKTAAEVALIGHHTYPCSQFQFVFGIFLGMQIQRRQEHPPHQHHPGQTLPVTVCAHCFHPKRLSLPRHTCPVPAHTIQMKLSAETATAMFVSCGSSAAGSWQSCVCFQVMPPSRLS